MKKFLMVLLKVLVALALLAAYTLFIGEYLLYSDIPFIFHILIWRSIT